MRTLTKSKFSLERKETPDINTGLYNLNKFVGTLELYKEIGWLDQTAFVRQIVPTYVHTNTNPVTNDASFYFNIDVYNDFLINKNEANLDLSNLLDLFKFDYDKFGDIITTEMVNGKLKTTYQLAKEELQQQVLLQQRLIWKTINTLYKGKIKAINPKQTYIDYMEIDDTFSLKSGFANSFDNIKNVLSNYVNISTAEAVIMGAGQGGGINETSFEYLQNVERLKYLNSRRKIFEDILYLSKILTQIVCRYNETKFNDYPTTFDTAGNVARTELAGGFTEQEYKSYFPLANTKTTFVKGMRDVNNAVWGPRQDTVNGILVNVDVFRPLSKTIHNFVEDYSQFKNDDYIKSVLTEAMDNAIDNMFGTISSIITTNYAKDVFEYINGLDTYPNGDNGELFVSLKEYKQYIVDQKKANNIKYYYYEETQADVDSITEPTKPINYDKYKNLIIFDSYNTKYSERTYDKQKIVLLDLLLDDPIMKDKNIIKNYNFLKQNQVPTYEVMFIKE